MQKLDKSKLTMAMVNKEKLTPYLDKALRSFDEPFTFEYKPKGHDDAWHPSGDCTPTALELYEKAQSHLDSVEILEDGDVEVLPADISPSLRKSFMVGHYWHQLIQYIIVEKLEFAEPTAIERVGKRVWCRDQDLCFVCKGKGTREVYEKPWGQSQFSYPPPMETVDCFDCEGKGHRLVPFGWATGSGDVAPLVLPSWQGVMDIKSMRSSAFKSNVVPFADKYECQINIYMEFFEEDQAMIFGVNKDSPHDFKEIMWVRNQPLIDAIYAKWKYVSEALDANVSAHEISTEFDGLPLLGPVV